MPLIDKDALIAEFRERVGRQTEYLKFVSLKTIVQIVGEATEIDPVHAAGGGYCCECEYCEPAKEGNAAH